jgi:DNA-binding CsgD family transcriptional regulator/tetratricopeptide (TPR) repeat protein
MELLERDHVWQELQRLLAQARVGHGCLMLLGGEAGIGKTVLLRALRDDVQASARVVVGHCDALSTPRALGPLFDFDDPSLNQLLTENAPRDVIFRTVLTDICKRGALTLLTIEDIHWADEATLDLVRYLGRRIEQTHALVVATFRDDEGGPRHPLRRCLGDLATLPAVRRWTLEPLTLEAVTALAAESGLDPGALHERTQGNPFFVTEILAAGGEMPATVRDAVLARVTRLEPSAWSMLETAAVIGSPIDPALLDEVTMPHATDVDACVESGILRHDGTALVFRHELAREAILETIPPTRCAALHRDVLRVLETRSSLDDPARLAHHAEAAGDATAVLRHAPEAARRAAAMQAHREAAAQYERALRFASCLPLADRARLLEARSYACYLTAQIDEAIAARLAALQIWIDSGDTRKEGDNRAHLAILYWAQARIIAAEGEAEAAIALLEQYPPGPELAMAYGALARLSGTTLDTGDAVCFGEKAIALAERTGATDTHIDAMITVGEAHLARGKIDLGQRQIELALRQATVAGLDEVASRAFISLGYGFAECGRFATATRHLERGINFCLNRDLDLPRLHMVALLARCQMSLGNWDDALRLAGSVLNAREVAPSSRFVALVVAGLVKTRRGDHDARSLLEEAHALATTSGCIVFRGPIHAARAEAAWLAGNAAETAAAARAVYDLAVARRHTWYISELTYWRWKAGDPVDVTLASAAPFAWQIAGDWGRAATAWEARGCPYEAARARADSDDEDALCAAVTAFTQLGARPAADQVRHRLRALGARHVPRGPRPATRANPGGLTAREVDVVRLLAAGHSNQAIATRLFLSSRTVEHHVAAAFAKLGVTTRTDAAAAARQFGLVSESG